LESPPLVTAPTMGPTVYTQSALYSPLISAGPMLLAGFIDAPETGLTERTTRYKVLISSFFSSVFHVPGGFFLRKNIKNGVQN
jgi:hypothetical protein